MGEMVSYGILGKHEDAKFEKNIIDLLKNDLL